MHPQLEILLQIQDLRLQQRELAEAGRDVEEQEFNINVDKALDTLNEKIADLENELEPNIRQRYERISTGRGRPVVPVINGICYGCFVSIPTALASDVLYNEQLRHCDNCGRFLYRID